MRVIRRLLLAGLLVLSAAPTFAGCLNMYNNALRDCDAYYCPNGVFTCAGCYADALGDYYGCVEQQMVN
jgi:hypothetical protein